MVFPAVGTFQSLLSPNTKMKISLFLVLFIIHGALADYVEVNTFSSGEKCKKDSNEKTIYYVEGGCGYDNTLLATTSWNCSDGTPMKYTYSLEDTECSDTPVSSKKVSGCIVLDSDAGIYQNAKCIDSIPTKGLTKCKFFRCLFFFLY